MISRLNIVYQFFLERPEETKFILQSFAEFTDIKKQLTVILSGFILSRELLHPYQEFLILQWIFKYGENCDDALVAARKIICRGESPDYLRNYAYAILGKWGDSADLDSLEAEYIKMSGNDTSQATIICSLRRMVKDRRNTLFGRAEGDGQLVNLAIRWAKQHR